MDAGHLQVSLEIRDSLCRVTVSGELTAVTEREFTRRAAEALSAFRGPVEFDLSGLTFVDRPGARALARALRTPPRAAGELPPSGAPLAAEARWPAEAPSTARAPSAYGVRGCSPAVRRVLLALGLDLPPVPAPARAITAAPPPGGTGSPSRAEALLILTRTSTANARQSAARGSEVMSRLAATYADLALSGRFRAAENSAERGRLLALSGRALDLSRRYQRHAASGAGQRAAS